MDGARESRLAFSLIELFVVTAMLAVLLAFLLPAVQHTRESARANACRAHLKQIGLAILQHETVKGALPIGAEGQFDRRLWPGRTHGFSWWAHILPYLELQDIAARLDHDGISIGWVQQNAQNGRAIDGVAPAVLFCPSSNIPQLVRAGGFEVAAPSYVGVSGATNHDGFPEDRVSECCRIDGEIAAGGVLVPNTTIRLGQITDGTSHTLLLGEQSDFAYTDAGGKRRIDPAHPNGWLCGTRELGTPPTWSSSWSPAYNLATIRYALNERRYQLPGVETDRGANNPMLSSHMGYVSLLHADGSVHTGTNSMNLRLVKSLATRDDGTWAQPL
jgi:type II secretory pathway pseudopilin PulG